MDDFLYRGVLPQHQIRFGYCLTTAATNDAILAHGCDPVAGHVLGRALSAAILTSILLQDDERYTLRWNYNGDLNSIVVDVGADADARGFVAPVNLMLNAVDTSAVYGDTGRIALIKSTSSGVLSSGVTEARLLDVIDDLTMYFAESDQIETAMVVLIGFNSDPEKPVKLCQGMILQAMPDCDLSVFEMVRQRLSSDAVRQRLACEPTHDNYVECIFEALLPPGEHTAPILHACNSPAFRCQCSQEKIMQVSSLLDNDDLKSIVSKGESLHIQCQFCARRYSITASDLASLL